MSNSTNNLKEQLNDQCAEVAVIMLVIAAIAIMYSNLLVLISSITLTILMTLISMDYGETELEEEDNSATS